MKFIFILLSLISFNTYAKDNLFAKCTLNLRPVGIWFNQCPPRMVADGVDVWNPGPSPFPQVRVRCVAPEIICETKQKRNQDAN